MWNSATFICACFRPLRVGGEDLRIRRRGLGDYPPLISIKSFHVEASIIGLYRKHLDHVRLDGLDINIAPSQARDKQKFEREKVRRPNGRPRPRPASSRRPEEQRRDPLKDGGVVIDRMDTNDARLIILPFEREKTPKVWAIHNLHMRDLGATALVAVQGDADQRRAARRNRGQRQVRPVEPRGARRHAA